MKKHKKTFYKKKETKQKKQPQKLPQNNRIISAWDRFTHLLLRKTISKPLLRGYFFALVLFFILLTMLNLFLVYQYIEARRERVVALKSLLSVEKLIQEHPNQTELYVVGARAALKTGDREKARSYIQKALFLNPSLDEAKQLQERIGK